MNENLTSFERSHARRFSIIRVGNGNRDRGTGNGNGSALLRSVECRDEDLEELPCLKPLDPGTRRTLYVCVPRNTRCLHGLRWHMRRTSSQGKKWSQNPANRWGAIGLESSRSERLCIGNLKPLSVAILAHQACAVKRGRCKTELCRRDPSPPAPLPTRGERGV